MLPSATGKLLGIKQQLSNTFRIPCGWVGHLKLKLKCNRVTKTPPAIWIGGEIARNADAYFGKLLNTKHILANISTSIGGLLPHWQH